LFEAVEEHLGGDVEALALGLVVCKRGGEGCLFLVESVEFGKKTAMQVDAASVSLASGNILERLFALSGK
jgi:hypothetical protein